MILTLVRINNKQLIALGTVLIFALAMAGFFSWFNPGKRETQRLNAQRRQDVKVILNSIESYYKKHGQLPTVIANLPLRGVDQINCGTWLDFCQVEGLTTPPIDPIFKTAKNNHSAKKFKTGYVLKYDQPEKGVEVVTIIAPFADMLVEEGGEKEVTVSKVFGQ